MTVRRFDYHKILGLLLKHIKGGNAGNVEVVECYSGKFDCPIQILLRDRDSLAVDIATISSAGEFKYRGTTHTLSE